MTLISRMLDIQTDHVQQAKEYRERMEAKKEQGKLIRQQQAADQVKKEEQIQ